MINFKLTERNNSVQPHKFNPITHNFGQKYLIQLYSYLILTIIIYSTQYKHYSTVHKKQTN